MELVTFLKKIEDMKKGYFVRVTYMDNVNNRAIETNGFYKRLTKNTNYFLILGKDNSDLNSTELLNEIVIEVSKIRTIAHFKLSR